MPAFVFLNTFYFFINLFIYLGADMDELERDLSIEVDKIRERAREQEETLKRQLEDSRERLAKEAEKREFLLEKVQDLEFRLKTFSSDVLYESKSFENFQEFSRNYKNENEIETENERMGRRESESNRENIENNYDENYDENDEDNINDNLNKNNSNIESDYYNDEMKRKNNNNNKPNMRYNLSENCENFMTEDQENEKKWKMENEEKHEIEQLRIISKISSLLERKSEAEKTENNGDASKTTGEDLQNRAPALHQISEILNSLFLNSDLELSFQDDDRILSQSEFELKRFSNALAECLSVKFSSIYPTQHCEKSHHIPIAPLSEKKYENLRQVR
jgi:hypothetical protein